MHPYLSGPYAPVSRELADLAGHFLQLGPDPRYPPRGRYHWFDGDGMVHAASLGPMDFHTRWLPAPRLEERG